ncbi:MBL fold metallo-hydrolase [candidate division KSB1 bacterium]
MKNRTILILITLLFLVLLSYSCGEKPAVDESSAIVQPLDWAAKLPRPVYATLERVEIADWWFEVYRLPHEIYVIYEPYQFEEAISYLVLGNDRALLIDTGTGIGDLKKVVDTLTDLPITVINTHGHYDHIGCNYQFGDIAVFNDPTEINRLLDGKTKEECKGYIEERLLRRGLPDYFNADEWYIPPSEPFYLLEEGTVIDFGGRQLETIHTPGHSPGEICLLDKANRVLFTGDMFFPGPLYAFGDDVDLDAYIAAFKKLNDRIDEFDYLCAGHNDPWVKSEVIPRVIRAFEEILSGQGNFDEESNIRRYYYDGFDVLIRADMIK